LQKQNHSFRVTRKLLQARKNITLHRGMYWWATGYADKVDTLIVHGRI